MNGNGLLIVVSGPSGAGKGTVCKAISTKDDLWISVSATTRQPRDGEINGVNYFFLSKEEFNNKINSNGFLEYAQVYNNYYGTPKSKVIEMLNSGKDVILEIDIQGAMQVKKNYPDAIFIFILPPSMDELRKRIINRGSETEESLALRFSSAYNECKHIVDYNYAVINDTVENAVSKIESIILAEKCKVNYVKENFKLEGGDNI